MKHAEALQGILPTFIKFRKAAHEIGVSRADNYWYWQVCEMDDDGDFIFQYVKWDGSEDEVYITSDEVCRYLDFTGYELPDRLTP